MATATLPLASATPTSSSSSSFLTASHITPPSLLFKSPSFPHSTRRIISCRLASASASASASVEKAESLSESPETHARIGARVRVKPPLKVYHVPRVPEMELTGMEGVIKQYVGVWKGNTISANLPYKVEFIAQIEGRGPLKFSAHLREDEFEYLDY